MEFGTTEWILVSYFTGALMGLLLGWLMWKDGATKVMEGKNGQA
jgi:hypothetical protein